MAVREREAEGRTGTLRWGETALGCTCLSIIHCPTLCASLMPLAFALTSTMRGHSKATQGCFPLSLSRPVTRPSPQDKEEAPVVTNARGPRMAGWRLGGCLVIGPWQLQLFLASGEALGPLLGNQEEAAMVQETTEATWGPKKEGQLHPPGSRK